MGGSGISECLHILCGEVKPKCLTYYKLKSYGSSWTGQRHVDWI